MYNICLNISKTAENRDSYFMKTFAVTITYDDSTMTQLDVCSDVKGVVTYMKPLSKMSKFTMAWMDLQHGSLTDSIKMYENMYGESIENNTACGYLSELVRKGLLVRCARGYYKLSTLEGPVEIRTTGSRINRVRWLFDVTPQINQSGLMKLYRDKYGVDINRTTLNSALKALVSRGDLVHPMRGVYHRSDVAFDPGDETTTSNIDKMRRLFDVTPQLNFADVGTWYKMLYGEDVPTATLTANLRTLVDRGDLIRPVRGVYHHPSAVFNPVQATPVSDCDRVAKLMEGFGSAGINRLVMEFPKVYGRKISTASVRNYVVKLHKSGKVERVRPGVYQWKGVGREE